MTPNFLWVLKGVAATFEDSLLYSIASLIILPKYVADKFNVKINFKNTVSYY